MNLIQRKERSMKDCLVSSRFGATCTTCGERPAELHMPMKLRGFFCRLCCPVCCPIRNTAGVIENVHSSTQQRPSVTLATNEKSTSQAAEVAENVTSKLQTEPSLSQATNENLTSQIRQKHCPVHRPCSTDDAGAIAEPLPIGNYPPTATGSPERKKA